jgi:hypothetical protein
MRALRNGDGHRIPKAVTDVFDFPIEAALSVERLVHAHDEKVEALLGLILYCFRRPFTSQKRVRLMRKTVDSTIRPCCLGHQDWLEPHRAGLIDRIPRAWSMPALLLEGEVNQHDAVLLDDADQEYDANDGDDAEIHVNGHD